MPEDLLPQALDELAADYAAISLNNSLDASPKVSGWVDDEHLACQRPMFELREIFPAAGSRSRFDDHLVLQRHYLRREASFLAGRVWSTA